MRSDATTPISNIYQGKGKPKGKDGKERSQETGVRRKENTGSRNVYEKFNTTPLPIFSTAY